MKLVSFCIATAALALPAFATALTSRDTMHYKCSNTYDDPNYSLEKTTCSDFYTSRGYYTLGSLPTFPYVGGMHDQECGTCWQITYEDTSVYFLVVDDADKGAVLSKETCTTLFDHKHIDRDKIIFTQLYWDSCGYL